MKGAAGMTTQRKDALGRRDFTKLAGVFAFSVGSKIAWLTPAQAQAQGVALKLLTDTQAAVLNHYGDALVPGAAKAGLAHFIDHQLAAPAPDNLLMIRYLGILPPFDNFYQSGAAALDAAAQARVGVGFAALDAAAAAALVADVARATPEGWQGPPPPFFHFVLRADALDVVYGGEQGAEALGMPYMAHITPPHPWRVNGDD